MEVKIDILEKSLSLTLEHASDEDLLQELYKRYSNCLLVYTKLGMQKHQAYNGFRWYGSDSEVLGLIEYAALKIKQDILVRQDSSE